MISMLHLAHSIKVHRKKVSDKFLYIYLSILFIYFNIFLRQQSEINIDKNFTETPNCQGIVSLPEASDAVRQIKLKIEEAREREEKKKEKEKEGEGKKRWRREGKKKISGDEEKQNEDERKGKETEEEEKEKKEPSCDVCGWIASTEKVRQYWDAVDFTWKKLKTMNDDNLSILFAFYENTKITYTTS